MENSYRANRKAFFLTYSQCGTLTKEQVKAHLESLGTLEKYKIALEQHQDGHPHIHAYVVYEKKRNFTNCRWADIDGIHPNDAGAPRSEACISRYCGKDMDYITNLPEKENPYAEAVALPTLKDAITHIRQKRTRDYVLYGDSIDNNLAKFYKTEKQPLPVDIVLRPEQEQIIQVLQQTPTRRTIHWIWSNTTGAGKTTFKIYCKSRFNILTGATTLKDTLYAYQAQDVIWFDVPRQDPLDCHFTSMLESLANQEELLSTKYRPVPKTVVSHIVVTCNRPPPHDKLPGRLIDYDWNSYGIAPPESLYVNPIEDDGTIPQGMLVKRTVGCARTSE